MIILSGVLSLVLSSSVSAASFGEQNVARFVSLKPERQLVLAENGTVNCEVVSPDGTAPARGSLRRNFRNICRSPSARQFLW